MQARGLCTRIGTEERAALNRHTDNRVPFVPSVSVIKRNTITSLLLSFLYVTLCAGVYCISKLHQLCLWFEKHRDQCAKKVA